MDGKRGQCLITVNSAMTEYFLEQTGKQHRANASGLSMGLAETKPSSVAVMSLIASVQSTFSEDTPSSPPVQGLGLLITTNSLSSFRHFVQSNLLSDPLPGHAPKGFPKYHLLSVFSSTLLPCPICHFCLWSGWFQGKGDINKFPLDPIQQSQVGNDTGRFPWEARHLLTVWQMGNQFCREQGRLTDPPGHLLCPLP